MNKLVKKMMCFHWAQKAYQKYLDHQLASQSGKFLLASALDLRKKYECAEERSLTFSEMMGIFTYYALYSSEVFEKIEQLPEKQEKLDTELSDIRISYEQVKETVPELTYWQFRHFELKMNLPDFRGKSVEEAGMQYTILFQASLMGILAELFSKEKGRKPCFLESPSYTSQGGVALKYHQSLFKKEVLSLQLDENRERS